jgi:NDP-sugar pyrophosphorylase family protein
MRSMSLPALALASLLTLPALAGDTGKQQAPASSPKIHCDVHTKDGSRAVQGSNLTLNAGEKAKSAVAIDGDVLIRKGASVGDVVAVHGKVTIEEGAEVKGDVVALGGELHLQKKAHVAGDAVALGGTLQMDEGASVGGDKVNFSLNINGEDIAQTFLRKALANSNCQLTVSNDDDGDDDDDDGNE